LQSTLRKMPAVFLAGLLLGPALVSGCTTQSSINAAKLTSIDTGSTFDVVLPDTVSVIPSLSDGTAVAALEATATDTAAATSPAAITAVATASVVTASYAGSAPSATTAATVVPIAAPAVETASLAATVPAVQADQSRGEVDRLITRYAALYEVPVELVRRVVKRESNFSPGAYNNGHWGLMQIKHGTARGMGYQGPARGLLDAETNLKYAVKYLRGAYLVADGDHDLAVRFYARGYYYDAKRMGLLDETGLGTDRRRRSI
jgi:soluble lytic murein transglycosylase-like protein